MRVPFVTVTVAIGLSLATVSEADVGFQTRFETGLLWYELEISDIETTRILSDGSSTTLSQESSLFRDELPFFGLGGTLFIDRFYIDVSGQITPSKSGSDRDRLVLTGERSGQSASAQLPFEADFDRYEYALSAGYQLNPNVTLFAGFKGARSEVELAGRGTFAVRPIDPATPTIPLDGVFTAKLEGDFEYYGPFVGVQLSLPIEHGALRGALGFSTAVAWLDGETTGPERNAITVESINGVPFGDIEDPINPTILEDAARLRFNSEGDTLGVTFGLQWQGLTPVPGLGYSVNVNGYRYSFDGKADQSDLDETVVGLRAALVYTF